MQTFKLEEFTDLIKSCNSMNFYATSDILEGKFKPEELLCHFDELDIPEGLDIDKDRLCLISSEGDYDFYENEDSVLLYMGDTLKSVYSTLPQPFIKMQSSNRTPTKDKEYAMTVGEIIDYAKKHDISLDTELAYGAAGVYNPIVEFISEDRSLILVDNTMYKSWKWTDNYIKKIKKIKDLKQFKVDLPVRFKFNQNPVNINSCYLDVYGGTKTPVLGLNINGVNDKGQLVKENSGLIKFNGKLNYGKAIKDELTKNVKKNSVFDLVGTLVAHPLTTYLSYKQLKDLTKGMAIREPSSFNTRTSSFTRNKDGSISFSKDNSMTKYVRYFSKVNGESKYFKAGQKLANDKPGLPETEIESAAKDAGVPDAEMTNFIFGYNSIDKKAPDFVSENSVCEYVQNVRRFSKKDPEIKQYSNQSVARYVKQFSLFGKNKIECLTYDGSKVYNLALDEKNAVERSALNLGRLLKGKEAIAFKTSDGPVYVGLYNADNTLLGLLCIDVPSDAMDINTIYLAASKSAKNKNLKKALLDLLSGEKKVPAIITALFDTSYEDKWVADKVRIGNNKWFDGEISDVTVKELNTTL